MPKYKLQAPDGRTVTVEGDAPPDEAAMDEIFAALPAKTEMPAGAPTVAMPDEPPAAPGGAPPVTGMISSAGHSLLDLLKGAAKETPLVVSRAAMAPERGTASVLATALDAIGAKDLAAKIRDREAVQKFHLEAPYAPGPSETTPEKVGRGVASAGPQVALAALTGGGTLPAQAAIQGLAGAAQSASEGAGLGEATTSGVLSAAAPLVAKGARRVVGAVSDKLKTSALKLYAQAFHPTKEATKVTAERILPQALERGVQGNLRDIGGLAKEQVDALGTEIYGAYKASTGAGTKISATQLADAMESLKVPFTEVSQVPKMVESRLVNAAGEKITTPTLSDEVVVLNPGAVSAINDVQDILRQLGPKATPLQIQKYKRVVDDLVSSSNGFTRELPRGSAKEIGKQARNAFKTVLNTSTPDVTALNAEYSFWRGMKKIVDETSTRKLGQQETVELLAAATRAGRLGLFGGGAAGYAASGGPGAAAGAFLGEQLATRLQQFLKTPLYRTWSAVQKNALADILAGNAKALATPEAQQVVTILALNGIHVARVKGGVAAEPVEPEPSGMAEANP